MSKEWNPSSIFDVLASEHARKILVATSVRPVSAQELKEICETSLPTIYRRVNALTAYDLLSEQPKIKSDGTQYNTYTSDLKEINIRVEDGELTVDIELQKDSVDQFSELISDLEKGQRQSASERDDHTTTDSSHSNSGSGTGSGI